eukprot:Amastigsp_a374_425.p4 type:complete len:173 gc:universal Amastigsp_a374_425:25-543(+)
MQETPSILFLCLGNICRSPLAQGVMEKIAADAGVQVFVDSAGTGDYHVGEAPDRRGQKCARGHGIDISKQRARQLEPADFAKFDLIVAMDRQNLRDSLEVQEAAEEAGLEIKATVTTFMSFVPSERRLDVPDCYYAADVAASFEDVFNVFCEGCPNVLTNAQMLASSRARRQ